MNAFSYKIRQNYKAASSSGIGVAFFSCNKLIKHFKENFKDVKEVFLVNKYDDANKIIEKIGFENISTIYTDIKSIFKKTNEKNGYYFYKKNVNDKVIILNNSEEYDVEKMIPEHLKMNVVISNGMIPNSIKKYGKKTNKIIQINEKSIDLALKVGGLWRVYNSNEVNINYLLYSKKIPEIIGNNSIPKIFKGIKKTEARVKYDGYNFDYDNAYMNEMVQWIIEDNFYSKLLGVIDQFGNFVNVRKKVVIKNDIALNKFINLIEDKKMIKGIQYQSIVRTDNDLYKISTNYGDFEIEITNNNIVLITAFGISVLSEFDLKKFVNSMIINIESYITERKNEQKVNKKEIIKAILGISVLIFLFYATFSLLFSESNILFVFDNIFSKESLVEPWIYLIILSFLFTLIQPLIVAIFMQKYIVKKQLNKTTLITYYISGMLRHVVSFVTGSYYIAMLAWGWYLNKKLSIKATKLVGTIGIASIIRGMVYLAIGSLFMIIGTVTYFGKYSTTSDQTIIAIFIVSWIGFFWTVINKLWIFVLILTPAFQVMATNITLWFKSLRKELKHGDYNSTYQNVLLLRKTSPKITWETHRVNFIRIAILVTLPIVVESIETVLYFDLIDSLALKSAGNYDMFNIHYNFIATSGLRLVATNIHHFPLLNMLPGKGVFFTEFGLNNLYEQIYAQSYGGISPWGSLTASDLSEMTTFLTRFFNMYLLTAVRMLILVIFMSTTFARRRKNV